MIEQVASKFFSYMFDDPVRSLVFLIISFSTYVILNHKENLKTEFSKIKSDLDAYSSNTLLMQATIEMKSAETVRMLQAMTEDLKKFTFEIAGLRNDMADYKLALAEHLFEVAQKMAMVTDLKKDVENNFGKVRIVDENYNKILTRLTEMKPKKP